MEPETQSQAHNEGEEEVRPLALLLILLSACAVPQHVALQRHLQARYEGCIKASVVFPQRMVCGEESKAACRAQGWPENECGIDVSEDNRRPW